MTLRIQLLGQLQVAGDEAAHAAGQPLRLAPRAQRLLAYLLLHRDAPLDRETLAFKLWPDQPETEALSALRRALSDLRAALPAGAEWVLAQANTLRWNASAGAWLDVAEFERLVADGAPEALLAAEALNNSDLLAGWGDEWLEAEREHFHQGRQAVLRRLSAHYRLLGQPRQALPFAQRLLALDPLAEASQRELISLHYMAGDRAAALAQYAHFQAQLEAELGVAPMPETQALAAAIRPQPGRPWGAIWKWPA